MCACVILVGVIELSLTVPVVNSLAFLFTVLGEWWAEGKVISRGEFGKNKFSLFFPTPGWGISLFIIILLR